MPSIFVSFVSKYGYTQNVRKNVTNNTAVDDFLCLLSSEERHDCMLCIFFTRFLQKTNKHFFLCSNNLFKEGKKIKLTNFDFVKVLSALEARHFLWCTNRHVSRGRPRTFSFALYLCALISKKSILFLFYSFFKNQILNIFYLISNFSSD